MLFFMGNNLEISFFYRDIAYLAPRIKISNRLPVRITITIFVVRF